MLVGTQRRAQAAERGCGPAGPDESVVRGPDVREVAERDPVGKGVRPWGTGALEGADRSRATALQARPVGPDRAQGERTRPAAVSELRSVRADLNDGVAPCGHRTQAARDEDEVMRRPGRVPPAGDLGVGALAVRHDDRSPRVGTRQRCRAAREPARPAP